MEEVLILAAGGVEAGVEIGSDRDNGMDCDGWREYGVQLVGQLLTVDGAVR